jgi:hypothetical protein
MIFRHYLGPRQGNQFLFRVPNKFAVKVIRGHKAPCVAIKKIGWKGNVLDNVVELACRHRGIGVYQTGFYPRIAITRVSSPEELTRHQGGGFNSHPASTPKKSEVQDFWQVLITIKFSRSLLTSFRFLFIRRTGSRRERQRRTVTKRAAGAKPV